MGEDEFRGPIFHPVNEMFYRGMNDAYITAGVSKTVLGKSSILFFVFVFSIIIYTFIPYPHTICLCMSVCFSFELI